MTEGMNVNFTAGLRSLRGPWHYEVVLMAEGYDTGVRAKVWGHKRALACRDYLINNANELLNELGLAQDLLDLLKQERKAKDLAEVKVGERVRLSVDLGFLGRGRVCRVVSASDQPGGMVGVVPVYVAGDLMRFSDEDFLPIAASEYVGIHEELPDEE